MFLLFWLSVLKKLKDFESKTVAIFLHLFPTPSPCSDSFELKIFQDSVQNIEKTFYLLKTSCI